MKELVRFANGVSLLLLAAPKVATPAADSLSPAAKLASAE
jgi:hypothetical protein